MAVKKLKVTTIVDNGVQSCGLLAEWGFSLFIETDELNILFDCGSTRLPFFNNLKHLGLDLSTIDKIFISHGHNDHTGNFDAIIKSMPIKPEIIIGSGGLHQEIYGKSWAGITQNKEYIKSSGVKFLETKETTKLSKDIISIGNIPMECDFESFDDNLFARKKNKLFQNTFEDEQALVIKTDKGIVVFTGCSHRGVVNVIKHAKVCSETDMVYAVIGGSHLMNADAEKIDKTVKAFKKSGIKKVALSHCTGDKAIVQFSNAFKQNFIFNKAGLIIDLI